MIETVGDSGGVWETTVSYDVNSDAILSIGNTKLPSTVLSSYRSGFDEVWQVVDEVVSGTGVGSDEGRHHYAYRDRHLVSEDDQYTGSVAKGILESFSGTPDDGNTDVLRVLTDRDFDWGKLVPCIRIEGMRPMRTLKACFMLAWGSAPGTRAKWNVAA